VGGQGLEHRPHRFGRLGQFRIEADEVFLRLVAGDLGFERGARRYGADRLRPGLVGRGALDDRSKRLDRGAGEPLLAGLAHPRPLRLAREPRRNRREHNHRRPACPFHRCLLPLGP
jgi:hypothetical protein